MNTTTLCSEVLTVMQERQCIRAFLPTAVSDNQIREILESARWAPSGVNTQPWQVAVVRGPVKQQITDELTAARAAETPAEPDYAYYPDDWVEPYASRRIACGRALYGALKIESRDRQAKMQAWNNNYRFFGAPVGLLFFVDKGMNQGSWLDMGMFLQNIMLAAQACGLATCPQASLADYPGIVRNILDTPESYALVCGMALGYADMNAPVNQYRLERENVDAFTRWYD